MIAIFRRLAVFISMLIFAVPLHAQYTTEPTIDEALDSGEFEVFSESACVVGDALNVVADRDDMLQVTLAVPPGDYAPVRINIVGTSLELVSDVSSEGQVQLDFPTSNFPIGTYYLTVNGFIFFEVTIADTDPQPYRLLYAELYPDEVLTTPDEDDVSRVSLWDNPMLNRMVHASPNGEELAYIADPISRQLPLLGGEAPVYGDCVSEYTPFEAPNTLLIDDNTIDLTGFSLRMDGDGTLLVMSDDTGFNEDVLLSDGEFSDPLWMPDGERIIYVVQRLGDVDLYWIDTNTREERPITQDDAIERYPTIAPDGEQVVYVVEGDETLELWTVALTDDADDELPTPEPLLVDMHNNSYPSYSPDGTTIAFTSDRGAGGAGIYLYDLTDGTITRLIDTEQDEIQPAWSPDGTLIFYSAYNPDNDSLDLYVLPLDGSFEPINITDDGTYHYVVSQLVATDELE
ncbi:MAG: TolB family protein [Anaerolineae bacterium]